MCAPRAGISTQQVVRLDDGTVLQVGGLKGPTWAGALQLLAFVVGCRLLPRSVLHKLRCFA